MVSVVICPKCRYKRTNNEDPFILKNICPSCGIVYAKFKVNKSAEISDEQKIQKIKQLAANIDSERQKKEERGFLLAGIKIILFKLLCWFIGVTLSLFLIAKGYFAHLFWIVCAYFYYRWYTQPKTKKERVSKRTSWAGNNVNITAFPVEIDYMDAYGEASNRQVDVQKIKLTKYHSYFSGYCHLREDDRQFRSDRVIAFIDLDTGEVIEDVDVFLIEKVRAG